MAALPDQAYGHCLVVTRSPALAAPAASVALRLGGWSRTAVLGHARRQALAVVESAEIPPPEEPPPGADLGSFARWLAATRPAAERSLLDLTDRQQLSPALLARALHVTTAEAGGRVEAAAAAWEADLDPALMAWLGPGPCAGLATVLGEPDTPTGAAVGGPAGPGGSAFPAFSAGEWRVGPARALSLAPAVAAHAAVCQECGDRLRAMTTVRSLVAREPLPTAPPEVAAVARSSWRRPPAAVAPDRLTRHRRPVAAALVGVLGAAGVAYLAWPASGPGGGTGGGVARLTQLPAGGSALQLTPPLVSGTSASVTLVNNGDRPVRWDSRTPAQWLRVSPSSGLLPAGGHLTLDLRASPTVPSSSLHTTVAVSGDDGSVAQVTYSTAGPTGAVPAGG